MQRLTATLGTIDLTALLPNRVHVDWCSEIFETPPAPIQFAGMGDANRNAVAYLVAGHYTATVASRAKQSWCCRLLLHQLLHQLQPDAGDNWAVAYNRDGAPQLLLNDAPSSYRLSFSHSGHYCAVALSRGLPVGIDIERCGSGRNFVEMSEFLGWQPEDGQETRFLDRWTLHEACAKVSARSALQASVPGFDVLSLIAQPGQLRSKGSWHGLQLHLCEQEPGTELQAHSGTRHLSAQLTCVLRPERQRPLAYRCFAWRGPCPDARLDSVAHDMAASA